ncbi:MAG TPA: metalloregulator ArsR/SmtB family transcription factor [Candidatus Limnocylindria bacterium]|nr:metalloregulator ArsR/SmtB family transcription factor [Candidatus Limnocylindria bacterium]
MTLSPELPAERDLRRLRTLYRALGDETRLRMIGILAETGPMAVLELARRSTLSQPLISWHLRILRLAGLIDTERRGREVICRLRLAAFEELRAAEARLIGGTSGIGVSAGQPEGKVPDVG